MMLKKIKSVCLIVAMLATMLVPVCGAYAKNEDVVLAEFSSVEAIESYMKAKTTLAPSTENTGMYEVTGKATINPESLKDLFNLSLNGLDATGYGYLNMWAYSPSEVASYVRVSLYDTNGKFQAYSFEVNWSGWKVISLPFDKPITVKPEFSLSTLGTMYVGTTGWEGAFGTWTSEHYLNFDKVWLSEEMPEEAKEEDKSVDKYGNKTLAAFSSEKEIEKLKSVRPKMALEPTYENTRLYDISAKASISLENPQSLLNITNLDLDFSQYSSLNFWMYSPKKTESGLALPIYDDKGEYCLYAIPVDFEGWKMICIDLQKPVYKKENFDITKVTSVNLDFNQWIGRIQPWEEDGYINIDRVWLSPEKVNPLELIGSSYPQNSASVPSEDLKLTLKFSNPVSENFASDMIKLYSDSNPVTDADMSVSADENTVYISLNNLEKNTDYELAFSFFDIHGSDLASEPFRFRTQSGLGRVYAPVFYDEKLNTAEYSFSGKLNASVRIDNMPEACLTVAVYDAQGRNTFLTSAMSDEALPDEIRIKDISIKADDTVVAFVSTASGDMTLLRNDITALYPQDTQPEEKLFENPAAQDNGVELTAASVEGNLLTLEGIAGVDEKNILFAVSDENGKVKQVFGTTACGETQFLKTCDLSGIALDNGIYSVCAFGYGFEATKSISFYYISLENQKKICSTVNSASDADDVKIAFEGSETSLKVESDALKNAYLTIYEQKPYESFQDIVETAVKSGELLEGLNGCNWTTLSDFLSDSKEYVLYGVEEAEYYFSLKERDQNKINDEIYKLGTSFDDFEDFRKIFIKVTNKFKNGDYSSQSKPSKGGGGGGGGGVGRVSITPSLQPLPESQPGTVPSNPSAEIPFSDITDTHWARAYVEKLYANGIISTAQLFRPDDNITREEFLKLILESFEIKAESGKVYFTDVTQDAWYAGYVGAAYELGIVNGESEILFGIGKPVSRQDASAMLYRAAKMYGTKFASENAQAFADEALISEYALDAIKALQSAGIINGFENGNFLPYNNMTRAEAAKIISCVLDVRNGEVVK